MTLSKKILTGFIVCTLILLGVAFISFKNSEKFIASNTLVDQTNKVLYEFSQILSTITDAESSNRGFIITGDDAHLESSINAERSISEHLDKVKELTQDNTIRQKTTELEKEIEIRFTHIKTGIALRKIIPAAIGIEKSREFIVSGVGKESQDRIFEIIGSIQKLELTLLAERKQANEDEADKFNLVFVILMGIIILVLIVVYSIVISNLKTLKRAEDETASKNWLLAGNTELNEKLIGDKSIEELANNTISFLCTYLKAQIGSVYLFNDKENALILNGRYAFSSSADTKERFKLNEGLIGQAAHEQEQISITDIAEQHIRITSSVLNAKPKHILIIPFLFEGKTMGVVEIGRLTDFNETEKEFINASMNSIAITVNTAFNQTALRELLEKVQAQKGEMEVSALEIEQQLRSLNQAAILSIADANGDIIYANDNFCKISKYSMEELLGKNHSVLKSGKQPAGLFIGMWKSISGGRTWKGEIVNKAKDGTFYWVDTTITPFKGVDGKIEKYVAIRFDITTTKNQMLELALQYDEKEKRAAELDVANIELAFQNEEKEKRADELSIANIELAQQGEELKTQQEELRQMNEELEEQAQNLKQQQEELQITNEELEEQTQSLEVKNTEVEAAKNDIEQKTKQLEISSKYKSEFLANMSHELRTPLNSLLILSKDLSENRNKNLEAIQVESAEIIYKSGCDLLVLINEVLDLSKIEAGKMSLNIETVPLKQFTSDLIRDFKHHAEQKGLKLNSKLDKELPESIRTDSQRLNQILKNILSNAIKFTEKGSVSISIDRNTESTIIISVTDTGIGIQEDKQMAVFEAFQQAEGGTSRKYGGTGLGLSISRELAKLLGCEIKLNSKLNEGSVFSLIIPLEIHQEQEDTSTNTRDLYADKAGSYRAKESGLFKPRLLNDTKYLNYPNIKDDRDTITDDDKTVLIIEDDLKFAAILLNQANKKGFKCLSAASGEDGLLLASKHKPLAIILDISLPGINGHTVLLELKANPSLRHIPVHIISAKERSLEPIREGAVEYLMKPVAKEDLEEAFNRIEIFVNRKIKNLLIIEDNENSRKAMRILIGNGDVKCFEAGTGKEALAMYEQNQIDCMILDIGLPDMSGFDLIHKLENIKGHKIPPIIVYTGKELTKEENNELEKYAESVIIKGVKSEERLLDETALFLHRTISNLPKSKQIIINSLYDKETIFQSKKILLVDDDMRNLFALSKILKERGMEIIKAENGKIALEILEKHPDINMVLVDIMMPEMDGYEAIRRIRSNVEFKDLPVIALTAKAMKEDKQKCIDAGANDYITKPIDLERLLSLMRVWLSK